MQRGYVSNQLILADDAIWQTPHVIQQLRRGDLRWDEFLRAFVLDTAFGMSEAEWRERLLAEGNVGLAEELSERLGMTASLAVALETQEQEWQEMVAVAKADIEEYMNEQGEEIRETDREEYEDLLNTTDVYVQARAYGDAVSTLEQALDAIRSLVERRRAAAAAAFERADAEVREARVAFAATRASKFPGGLEWYRRAQTLLPRADEKLYSKEYATAVKIAGWVKAMCEGREFPVALATEMATVPDGKAVNELSDQPEPALADEEVLVQAEDFDFQIEWTNDSDAILIDNYDVMTNGQLKLRLYCSEDEIERRIRYLGLEHDRDTGKRVRWRNPYVAGKPLRGTRTFVGREDVFAFIESTLGQSEGVDRNLAVLLGHRRTGKTSILLQLRKNRRDLLAPKIPLLIDMQGLLPFPGGLRNFLWKLACGIRDELSDLEDIRLPMPVEDDFRDPSWAFQRFLREAEDATSGRGLVLMLDEFQALEPRRALQDYDVYGVLRHVIQHDTRVDFLLSGTMEMEKLMRRYRAALFGSSLPMRIDFLSEKSARQLITVPVQSRVTFDPKAVDLIVEATASHPYFLQLVCWTLVQYLIDRGKSKVFTSDVQRILPKALEQGAHFDEIWATETSDLECYVMAVVGEIARDREDWCTVKDVERRLIGEGQMPRNAEDLDEAIASLTGRRILQRSDDGRSVRFQVDVFGKWVNTNKPFEVVRRDIRAEAAARNRRIRRQPQAS